MTEKIQLAKKGTEDMMVFIVIPTPSPDRANSGSSTRSIYLAKRKLDTKSGRNRTYQPKLLQKCETASVRKGTEVNILLHGTESFLPAFTEDFG